MKKISLFIIGTLFALVLSGCASDNQKPEDNAAGDTVLLKVGSATVPHSELLEFVQPVLEEQGILLEITLVDEAQGTNLYNEQTDNGEFDVNFVQHLPYLESVKEEKGFDLESAGNIHVEPIGFYSESYEDVSEIPEEATFAIPNDVTNEYRALSILEQNGFIQLKQDAKANYAATVRDIETYLKPVTLVEMDSAAIIRIRDEFDGYITNTNKMLEAGLDPGAALFREGKDSPYANILTVKSDRVEEPAIKALFEALTSEEVRAFIEEKYNGAVIPAF